MQQYTLTMIIVLLLCCFMVSVHAQEMDNIFALINNVEDKQDFEALLLILNKQTKIATKTKMNADYVPGIITVLTQSEMELRGARTIEDAIQMIPGIELSIDPIGHRQIIVRGIGKTNFSGKLNLMLNDININDSMLAMPDIILDLPIEMIERIEMIRGPGSSVYGEFAYSGVLNVITNKKNNQVVGEVGDHFSIGSGANLNWHASNSPYHLNINLYGYSSNGAEMFVDQDIVHEYGEAMFSNAPGHTNESKRFISGITHFNYKQFTFSHQMIYNARGEFFGSENALPPQNNATVFHRTNNIVNVRQTLTINNQLNADCHLGWMRFEIYDKDAMLYPENMVYTAGLKGNWYYDERKLFGGIDFKIEDFYNHTLLLGLSFATTKIQDAYQETTYTPSTFEPLPYKKHFQGSENFINSNTERKVFSLMFQDEYPITSDLNLTAGIRYDNYNDTKDNFSPRISCVYSLDSHNIFKAQYANAFRPPNFNEEYWMNIPGFIENPDIEPEYIETYEIGYITKHPNTLFRSTLFYSKLDNMIIKKDGMNQNADEITVKGVELEFEHNLFHMLKLYSALSYNKTEDKNNHELPGVANFIGQAGMSYNPFAFLSMNITYRFTSDREREFNDDRIALESTHVFDLSIVYRLLKLGVKIRAGVSNIFNEDIRYPCFVSEGGLLAYPNDYPRPGREWWLLTNFSF